MPKGVSMNKISFAFLFVFSVCFAGNIFCMEEDLVELSAIEKEIFLKEVDDIGIEAMSNMLAQAKSPEPDFSDYRGSKEMNIYRGMRKYSCFTLELSIDGRVVAEDSLYGRIFKMAKEGKSLGAYTNYECDVNWVSIDCDFNDKRVLEKILNEFKENK